MGSGWQVGPAELIVPAGAAPGSRRRTIGEQIPTELAAYRPDLYEWLFADVTEYGGGGFYFEAMAHYVPLDLYEVITGEYLPTGGVQLFSFIDGSGSADYPALRYGSDNNSRELYTEWRHARVQLSVTSRLTVEDPTLDDGTAEEWHAVALANGWTTYPGGAKLSVMLVPSPKRQLHLYGRIQAGTTTNGITVATMPNTNYYPTKAVQFTVCNWGAVTCTPGSVETDGTIKLWGTFSGNVSFNALVPLDGGAP